tara:strand:+ start:375 stop:491 length:117 start_codon:yes stop_codon:yes gene_type:complete
LVRPLPAGESPLAYIPFAEVAPVGEAVAPIATTSGSVV